MTPEERITRYLAKIEANKDNSLYMSNPHIQKCMVNGKLDMAKVRDHFVQRQILTVDEFNTAVASLRSKHEIDANDFKANQRTLQKHEEKETELHQKIAAKEALEVQRKKTEFPLKEK